MSENREKSGNRKRFKCDIDMGVIRTKTVMNKKRKMIAKKDEMEIFVRRLETESVMFIYYTYIIYKH